MIQNSTTHPMISIYRTAAQKGVGWGWYEYTQYLNEGITYPRGKLLDISQGLKLLKEEIDKSKKCKSKKAIQPELVKKIFGGDKNGHFYVADGYRKLNKAFKELKLSRKNLNFSKYIILRNLHPKLAKYKFLAWII